MSLDDRVNAWLLERWLSGKSDMWPAYNRELHGNPDGIQLVSSDAGWECDCYSEYTRDDREILYATFLTARGSVYVRYGSWVELPRLLEELVDYGESECVYDQEGCW